MGMGIITELEMGMERNGNWLHGNVKKLFPQIYSIPHRNRFMGMGWEWE